jgi:hypothetical protein
MSLQSVPALLFKLIIIIIIGLFRKDQNHDTIGNRLRKAILSRRRLVNSDGTDSGMF